MLDPPCVATATHAQGTDQGVPLLCCLLFLVGLLVVVFDILQWQCLTKRESMWDPDQLPALCFACLTVACKAEDQHQYIPNVLKIGEHLRHRLPPYGHGNTANGAVPSRKEDILHFEQALYRMLGADTTVDHGVAASAKELAQRDCDAYALTRVFDALYMPTDLRKQLRLAFLTRPYTDCDLCLQKDKMAVIAAMILFQQEWTAAEAAHTAEHSGAPTKIWMHAADTLKT